MKKIIFLLFMLTFFNNCKLPENSNYSELKEQTENNSVKQKAENITNLDAPNRIWSLTETDNVSVIKVSANPNEPDNAVQAVFEIHCKKTENTITNFNYIIRNSDQVSGFGFDNFKEPNALAQTRQTVSIEAFFRETPTISSAKARWRFFVMGMYGCNGESNAFCFSPSTKNIPNASAQIARLIAEGGISLTLTVSDYKNSERNIRTELPPIDPESDVAKILSGCRF